MIITPTPDTVLPLRPLTADQFKPLSPELSLGTKLIGGFLCIGRKAVAKGPNYPGGESWVAPGLNYELVEGTVLDTEHDLMIKVDLEDIRLVNEPDPRLFSIPEGFQPMDSRCRE